MRIPRSARSTPPRRNGSSLRPRAGRERPFSAVLLSSSVVGPSGGRLRRAMRIRAVRRFLLGTVLTVTHGCAGSADSGSCLQQALFDLADALPLRLQEIAHVRRPSIVQQPRSEERRVGKEGRARRAAEAENKKKREEQRTR